MKIRIRRIGRSDDYTPHLIDQQMMEGTIRGTILPGKELCIHFAQLSLGNWLTTKVVGIEYHGKDLFSVHTKNSIYLVAKGWVE